MDLLLNKSTKKKRKTEKLTPEKLLHINGFNRLINQSKNKKFTKDSTRNLNDLMQSIHVWAHEVFPKSNFKEFIRECEKICKTKRLRYYHQEVINQTRRDMFNILAVDAHDSAREFKELLQNEGIIPSVDSGSGDAIQTGIEDSIKDREMDEQLELQRMLEVEMYNDDGDDGEDQSQILNDSRNDKLPQEKSVPLELDEAQLKAIEDKKKWALERQMETRKKREMERLEVIRKEEESRVASMIAQADLFFE